MSDGALAASGITRGFSGAKVLHAVDLSVPKGGVLAILGPSGSGKTTLLHILGGLLRPDAGHVELPFERPAFVFQDPLLLPWRTARGNVAFGLAGRRLSRAERLARARSMLVKVGLGHSEAGLYPHQLSGGMKKRVALARALVIEPDLLLLDEAFSALDVGLSREMQQLVRLDAQERGVTVVLVTHDLSEAVRLADEAVVLSGRPGRIVTRLSIDRPSRLRDDAFVEEEIRRIAGQEAIRDAFRPTLSG
ncbi:nitrate/sulfonate/bicarbonate ABC transporter ATP-binding protein [Pleomorphomonas diazotrophica]|uniref:Nitrate/sulfonate/bicarbonate ABC transporter ATP-binding protein n=1 Tax=Pleomorphomonas diazotrophica TaxID=1166257 RepID=A0A1I4RKR7_9HYPH|nr:ATP-binding cassette domain-containing protein [Pleomorphomonas diazotrophica]PKR87505.1 nitrate/sulfonate/bicarbonate ABC transporter ATP-binding protein [Pleomorphomonas diazotrophica]SFM52819.1 NitT/TauT family transport system ATP-binding protein [Pleomorphomonas diazotrophica]